MTIWRGNPLGPNGLKVETAVTADREQADDVAKRASQRIMEQLITKDTSPVWTAFQKRIENIISEEIVGSTK